MEYEPPLWLEIVTTIIPLAYLAFCILGSRREPLWPRTDGEASFVRHPYRGGVRSGPGLGPSPGDGAQNSGE